MKELKFRAWVKENKEWFYTYLDINKDDFCGEEIWLDYDACKIIEQYTGLKDKNGKEIYEGDIIEVETSTLKETEVSRYVVYWNEYMFDDSLKLINGTNYDDYIGDLSPSSVIVIGNIHENTDLLVN